MDKGNIEVQENFIVGDSWLYFKLYSGAKTSDRILTEAIKFLSEKLIKDNIIDKWFFIRYSDPKHHLRVRFHYNNPANLGYIINELNPLFKNYSEQDMLWKIQIETYQREIARYGRNTMELSEDIFFHDSKMISHFIENYKDDELRWLFSLKAVDAHLNCFEYSLQSKQKLMEQLKTNFRNEFGESKSLNKVINTKYRTYREKIDAFMDNVTVYEGIDNLLDTKNRNMKSTVQKILEIHRAGQLEVNIHNLNSSYIHMLMNRLFKSQNRTYEMICYDFLHRYYRSKIAKAKYVKSENITSI